MSNKKVHFNTPGHIHELTFSCYKGRKFLLDDRYCKYLAEAIIRAREKSNFKLIAYVFMPEHVHLLLQPEREHYSISEISKSIKQSSSRRIMILHKKSLVPDLKQFETGLRSKPYRFWQDGGGYDRNIIKKSTMLNSIDYIHNNPVKKGLVKSPEEWFWSSYNEIYDLGEGPISIDLEYMTMI